VKRPGSVEGVERVGTIPWHQAGSFEGVADACHRCFLARRWVMGVVAGGFFVPGWWVVRSEGRDSSRKWPEDYWKEYNSR